MAVSDPHSPIHGSKPEETEFKDGRIFLNSDHSKGESYTTLLARHQKQTIEAVAAVKPQLNTKEFSCHSFGAIFAEVMVDPDLGTVRTRRIVAVYDVGKIMNEKLAKSQFIGGIIWGISLALLEETAVDARNGRIMSPNLADYRVPVNSDIGENDIGEIDVSALDIPDPKLDSLGARGIGEIGITGTGAAIANAIFHATGKRVRDLPITPDKLL